MEDWLQDIDCFCKVHYNFILFLLYTFFDIKKEI